eukprot:12049-Heterococcus_DN1.PRE.1
MLSRGNRTSIFVCYAAATMVLVDITRARAKDANYPGQRVHAKHSQDPEVKISASSFPVLSSAATRSRSILLASEPPLRNTVLHQAETLLFRSSVSCPKEACVLKTTPVSEGRA